MAGFPSLGIGTHYGDTSLVEDVTDIIYQITPEDKPFFVMIGVTGSKQTTHQWQRRALTTRQHNAQGEGFPYTFTGPMTLPTRVQNFEQIFAKEIRVSNTEVASSHYAIDNLWADQMEIRLAEVGTDVEHALIQGTLVSGSATSVATQLQGIINAITSNASTYTLSALVSLSEAMFNDFFQAAWDIGGSPRDVLVGGYMKRKISGYTGGSTKFIPADEQRLVNTISMYETDFFPAQIHLSRDIPRPGNAGPAASGYSGFGVLLVDRTMCKTAYLRRFVSKRTPEIADSNDGVVTGELSLEFGNAGAHYYADKLL